MNAVSTAIDGAVVSRSTSASCGLSVGVSESYRRSAGAYLPDVFGPVPEKVPKEPLIFGPPPAEGEAA